MFSVALSFVIWIAMNSGGADSPPVTISDIPVSLSLSDSAVQDGLRIFGGRDAKASVDISGNKLIVGQVTKDDIQVTAQQAASVITAPGNYTLELTAKKTGVFTDYEFASAVRPAFIVVKVDRYREAEFSIESEIEFSAHPERFVGTTVLSSQKVVASGPESEISKIKRVVVRKKIEEELGDTVTFKAPILTYDAYGEAITSENVSYTVSEVDVTIPILTKKSVKVNPSFSNSPKGLYLSSDMVKVSPSSLEIAGPENEINGVDEITLESIDFTEINVKNNRFTLPITLPSGCKSLNNVYSADVYINVSQFKEKSIWVTKFSFLNLPEGKNAKTYTDGLNVKIAGYPNRLREIDASSVEAQIDLKDKENLSGSMEVPVKILINGYGDVWASGEYSVNIEIV